MINSTPSDPNSDWENLLARARADQAPAVDLAAVLRAVRKEPYPPRPDWAADFIGLFASARTLTACAAGIGALALLTSWQAWMFLQDLPWAQLLNSSTGGAL